MPAAITPPTVNVKPILPAGATEKKRKIVCFSDFDGTIFMQDTGHVLFDNFGCGSARRQQLDQEIHTGARSFREVSEEMWGSLSVPFDDGFEVMAQTLEIDAAFREFHKYCLANDIPFNVISAGLKPVLQRVLDDFLGEEAASHIDIVANDASISADGSSWKPIWRHDTELGHDKALSVQEARAAASLTTPEDSIPLIVFIGDGVSDLPAAREADVLFARRGLRLEEFCIENKIAHIPFDTFADIQKELERIAAEDKEKTQGEGLPVIFNPRANMWRRASSKREIAKFVVMSPTKEAKMFLWPEAFTEVVEVSGAETPVETPTVEKAVVQPVAA